MDSVHKHLTVDYSQSKDCQNNHSDIDKLVDDLQLRTKQTFHIGRVTHIDR